MYHLNFSCNVRVGKLRPKRGGAWPDRPLAMRAMFIAAAFLCAVEASAMADSTASFGADAIGAAPKGWTATKTGKGDSKWTIEDDKTSNSKVLRQSGRATFPLLLK